ncbi:MAG: hypothetical protein ABH831_01865 [Candidatus Nealsonbacteria bacterium]
MIRKVRFEEVPPEFAGKDLYEIPLDEIPNPRLRIDPPLEAALIEKLKTIKGVGWVDDRIDYAAISRIDPEEIILESGCPTVWCSHMRSLVSEIVEVIKKDGEVKYEGPSYLPSRLWQI